MALVMKVHASWRFEATADAHWSGDSRADQDHITDRRWSLGYAAVSVLGRWTCVDSSKLLPERIGEENFISWVGEKTGSIALPDAFHFSQPAS